VLERVMVLSKRAPMFVGLVGLNHGLAGRHAEAARLAGELEARRATEYVVPSARLMVQVGLRNRDGIREALQDCIDRRCAGSIVEGLVGPFLDDWMADPRVIELARALHLAERGPTS
jgi:hypothetical protein